ncbi:MAG: GGDEF domain-containing protein [Marinobacterium sp.]|nr:GGDEF domain-containing protein [Marinobacterium sp.]
MKFAKSTQQANHYLRQAIPLMVRHNIPPNPLNYALWYTYVSQEMPELNTQIDKALETYGTCPSVISEQMFREHIISDELEASDAFESSLLNMVDTLNQQASNTARHTEDYSEILHSSLEAFDETTQDTSLKEIINQLAASTQAVTETTRAFQQQLDAAQNEIENLRNELHKSRQEAHVDPLTGLYNRRIFDNELGQRVSADNTVTPRLCLIMVDVDHFKKFNDTYGHLMGDKVLQYVGKLLRDNCTHPLLPVRYGGEEFSVLAPGCSIGDAVDIAEQLRTKIQAIRIRQRRSGDVISSVTASFGISQLQPGQTASELIEAADNALYQAKENGRNRVECG